MEKNSSNAVGSAATGSRRIRLLVADDHPVVRAGLTAALSKEAQFDVIAEANDGEEAWERLSRDPVDVAVIDVGMPQLDGLSLVARAREKDLDTSFVVVTVRDDPDTFARASELEVEGYVHKDRALDDILAAVDAVSRGERFVSRPAESSTMPVAKRKADVEKILALLTPAERTVLQHLAMNKTSRQIASELHVSVRTVQNHRANVCDKLELRGTNKLLQFALENKNAIVEELAG
jgi:DNA-binding NarL/FixJ family response regulator